MSNINKANIPVVSINDLTEAVTTSVLNALSRRIDIDKYLKEDNGLIFDPIITCGGRLALFKGAALPQFVNTQIGR